MARDDDDFVGRVGSLFGTRRTSGSTGDLLTFEDFLRKYGAEEDGGKTPGLPFQPSDFGPNYRQGPGELPRRLATYAHGFSYSQGKYPGGAPRYFDGDELAPGRMPPHNIAALQRLLVDAGLLDNPRWGFWDTASQEAYQRSLSEANGQGVDVQTLLTTYADAAAMAEAEARGPYVPSEPLTLRTTNPEDLKLLFRDVSARALGVGWTDREIDELVNAYNWKEIAVQADAYAQNVERERQIYETGATDIEQIHMVEPPSPETYAISEAKRRDPAGYQATQIADDFAPAFFDALGGYT